MFIFPFPRSGVDAKGGVKFSHTAMLSEFGGKWLTECLKLDSPHTLLCAGYSVKVI